MKNNMKYKKKMFFGQREKVTEPENGPHPLTAARRTTRERGDAAGGEGLLCDFFPLAFFGSTNC
jgi:hypothetical protein